MRIWPAAINNSATGVAGGWRNSCLSLLAQGYAQSYPSPQTRVGRDQTVCRFWRHDGVDLTTTGWTGDWHDCVNAASILYVRCCQAARRVDASGTRYQATCAGLQGTSAAITSARWGLCAESHGTTFMIKQNIAAGPGNAAVPSTRKTKKVLLQNQVQDSAKENAGAVGELSVSACSLQRQTLCEESPFASCRAQSAHPVTIPLHARDAPPNRSTGEPL